MEAPGPRVNRTTTAVIATAVAMFCALVVALRRFVTDDAYISLRYARNFAEGHGPVWNPGGETVEGFSNPLLVAIEALAFRVGLDGVVVARGLGVLAGIGLIVACYAIGRHVVGRRAAATGSLIVAASPGLAYWAVGGLETLPMALVLTVAALELARQDGGSPLRAGLLLAVLPWLRPEGLLVAAALVLFSEVGGLRDPQRRVGTLRRLVWLAGLPLLSQIGLQLGRLALYGQMIPNSVLYKGGSGDFAAVPVRFLAENAMLWPLVAIAVVRLPGRAKLLAVPGAAYLVGSVTWLDSVNLFSRLLLPTLPLWALLAGAALARRSWRAHAAATLSIVTLMLLVMPASLPIAHEYATAYRECRHTARRQAGLWLRDRLQPGERYAIADAGVVPYFADGFAIDIFGLNEPDLRETGRTPPAVRAERILTEQPRFYIASSRRRDDHRPIYPIDRRIVRHKRFDDTYALQRVTGARHDGCDYYLYIFETTTTG